MRKEEKQMKAKVLWRLEKKINEFIEDVSQKGSYDGYYHPELAEQMATAAAQVFDATFMAQAYNADQSNST